MSKPEIEVKILIDHYKFKWEINSEVKESSNPKLILFADALKRLIKAQEDFLNSVAGHIATYEIKQIENEFLSNEIIPTNLDFLKKKFH